MRLLFEGDLKPRRIIDALKIETNIDITPKDTLIMFVDLYPLSFNEFLLALGENELVNALKNIDIDLLNPFRNKIIEYLKQYYFVGGMPAPVNTFVETKDMKKVREEQNKILMSYEQDFSKHAPTNVVPRIRQLWNNIPTQLAKENKKFIYGLIREGARAREYEIALSWLIDCGLIYQVNRIKKPDIPLIAYQDFAAFKLYILDVGLLNAMANISVQTLLDGNKIFEEFKGSLTEQYVLQELKTNIKVPIFYWSSEKGNGEIDFIIQYENNVIPIEVKAEENLMAKSLKSFANKYGTNINIRISMSNYRKENLLVNIPLYLIGNLKNILF